MGQTISSHLNRHKRKYLFVGGVIGGVYLLNTYMRRKLFEWERSKRLEYMNVVKKKSHFKGTMETCDSAVLSFMPKVREIIVEAVNVDPIVEELKRSPKNKLELWDELKVMVFTQIITEMYSQCLLTVLLRVQLCVLSGYIYANTQKTKTNLDGKASENQQKYLSHIASFLVGGVKDLVIPIEDSVRKSLRGIKLSDSLKLADFAQILRKITDNVSQESSHVIPNIEQYLMLPEYVDSNQNENVNYDDIFLEKIVQETRDILECEDFQMVLSSSLEIGIAVTLDRISECYVHIGNNGDKFSNPHSVSAPLAKLIPKMHMVFQSHKPNGQGSLVFTLLQQENLKVFAANLYEAFSEVT